MEEWKMIYSMYIVNNCIIDKYKVLWKGNHYIQCNQKSHLSNKGNENVRTVNKNIVKHPCGIN